MLTKIVRSDKIIPQLKIIIFFPAASGRDKEVLLMPQYELMYLLGSHVADTEVPEITAQILKSVENFGGSDIKESQLGKKKLAYPIKKTRNGHYVVVNFAMDANKINEFDAKIHTQDDKIIRYLLVNLDEHLTSMAKDKIAQSKIRRKIPAAETQLGPVPERKEKAAPTEPLIEINQEELDKKIEEALSEDLTK